MLQEFYLLLLKVIVWAQGIIVNRDSGGEKLTDFPAPSNQTLSVGVPRVARRATHVFSVDLGLGPHIKTPKINNQSSEDFVEWFRGFIYAIDSSSFYSSGAIAIPLGVRSYSTTSKPGNKGWNLALQSRLETLIQEQADGTVILELPQSNGEKRILNR